MESHSICVIHWVTSKLLHMYMSMVNLGIAMLKLINFVGAH